MCIFSVSLVLYAVGSLPAEEQWFVFGADTRTSNEIVETILREDQEGKLCLVINCPDLTDVSLPPKISSRIHQLMLSSTPVHDRVLSVALSCESLIVLSIDDCGVSSEGLINTEFPKKLRALTVRSKAVNDHVIAHLKLPETIKSVDFSGSSISSKGIGLLLGRHQLTSLKADSTNIGNKACAIILSSNLQEVAIKNSKVDDLGFRELVAEDRLRTIEISDISLSEATLEKLCTTKHLRHLVAENCGLDELKILDLFRRSKIETIRLGRKELNPKTLRRLRRIVSPYRIGNGLY